MDKRAACASAQRGFHSTHHSTFAIRDGAAALTPPAHSNGGAAGEAGRLHPLVATPSPTLSAGAVDALEQLADARSSPACGNTAEAAPTPEPDYLPLSRTTERVLRMLLDGDLSRLRAETVAEKLGISCTTLRRRLRRDHTSYQFLLDRARQYRCESRLRKRWLPGKCLAEELGYLEVNSFYRAFRRWTGLSYSAYKQAYH